MEDEKIEFVPFHAINNFMILDYKQHVLMDVFNHLDQLENSRKGRYLSVVRKSLSIPGFRNSSMAPLPMKIKAALSAFEKNPEYVIQTIACWAEIHTELRQKVYDLLVQRDWKLLPVDADRSVLPGFQTKWHPTDTYEVINQAFDEKYGEGSETADDVRLMTVWLSNRLPFENNTNTSA